MHHLLTTENLPRPWVERVLDRAEALRETAVPLNTLAGKTVCTLFFEASTRTRSTFELAAQRLGAQVLNLAVSQSSTAKGETLLDTLKTLEAMRVDMFVVRHQASGTAHFLAEHTLASVVNAGDGRHAHPTQALLDALTLRQRLGQGSGTDFSKLSVAIVGDVFHSRVARSNIHLLQILGCTDVRVVAPRTLVPVGIEDMGVKVFHRFETGTEGADVILLLRLQTERMLGAFLPSLQEFHQDFGLTRTRLQHLQQAKPDVVIMHPGPINRGVEIESELAYDPASVILPQVENGVLVRMAVMEQLLGAEA